MDSADSPPRDFLALAAVGLLVIGCGGGGGDSLSAPSPGTGGTQAVDAAEASAARFLTRATFGPTPEALEEVLEVGHEAWLDAQLAIWPGHTQWPSMHERVKSLDCNPGTYGPPCPMEVSQAQQAVIDRFWWDQALHSPGQLRARVAFAWSEIFVVSLDDGLLNAYPIVVAGFHDTLQYGAFKPFRQLLEDVARDPAMGTFLSMVKSRVADPEAGNHPDENFAREVMQLFTIGLVELEPDGTVRLDGQGQPIATFDQSVVEGLARVFTGYNYSSGSSPWAFGSLWQFLSDMPRIGHLSVWPTYHDEGAKLLPGGGYVPASGSGWMSDIEHALDALANHPNVGPFLGRQLIQRLVTSNPSPAYVGRVAAVWADDGSGNRGNIGAVVKAILLDPEADAGASGSANGGKVREPLLRATALWRAFRATEVSEDVVFPGRSTFGQAAYRAPSVFNFYFPNYATPALMQESLVSPEMQISSHDGLTRVTNFLFDAVLDGNNAHGSPDWIWPRIDVSEAVAVADDVGALLNLIDLRLCGGTMGPDMRATLSEHLVGLPAGTSQVDRALEAIAMTVASPQFSVQR